MVKRVLFIFLIIISPLILSIPPLKGVWGMLGEVSAQNTPPLPKIAANNAVLKQLYSESFNKKREVVFNNERYRVYNNYVTGGAGVCYNNRWQDAEFCPAFDYNFHVGKTGSTQNEIDIAERIAKQKIFDPIQRRYVTSTKENKPLPKSLINYFQVGGLVSGPGLGITNCIEIHACWGYRFERYNYMWAAYGGPSYTGGYVPKDNTSQLAFRAIGAYAAFQFFYKARFDYGIGFTAFVDYNTTQALTGIRLELFFSGAYRGLKNHNGPNHEVN
ncbi:MAG: hypothetical protein ACYDEC_02030 [Bacteroidia bacterium]